MSQRRTRRGKLGDTPNDATCSTTDDPPCSTTDGPPCLRRSTRHQTRQTNPKTVSTQEPSIQPKKRKASSKSSKGKKSKNTETEISSKLGEEENILCPCNIDITSKISWICCSKCQIWWHAKCAGITSLELSKYKANAFFKCFLCIYKDVPHDLFNRITNRVQPDFTGPDTDSREPQQPYGEATSTAEKQHDEDKESPGSLISDSNNIVIIDNIANPSPYKNSGVILKEIKTFKPNLNVKHAYVLPAGGIALHCRSEKDKQEALEPWPEESFEHSSIVAHEPSGAQHGADFVCRNISKHIRDTDIVEAVKFITGDSCQVQIHRFKNRSKNCFMPLARITISDSSKIDVFLQNGLLIGRKILPCQRFRKNLIIRCYNCQGYGHISKLCDKPTTCDLCGDRTGPYHSCGSPFCCNCNTPGHTASSKICPLYQKLHKHIHHRHTEQYAQMSTDQHTLLRNV